MYEIDSKKYFNEDNQNYGQMNNLTNKFKTDRSFNNSFQKENLNTAYSTYNNINQTNNNLSSFERYKNQQLLNKARIPLIPCKCNCHINSNNSQRCPCHIHHFHIHHIHIPNREQFLNYFTTDNNISEIKNLNNSFVNSNNLLKEVTELRNECRKFKEELERSNNENGAEAKYIRELENKINMENKNDNNNNNNNIMINSDKYHDMLDKSFEILNSVSKKCKDEKAKTKGGIYYYMNKDPDYNQLIQAQKKWIDNLPENNKVSSNLLNFNNSISKTYSINDQTEDDQNINNLNNNINNSKLNDRNSNNPNQINNNNYKMNNNPYNFENSYQDKFNISNKDSNHPSEMNNDNYIRNNLNNQIRGINDNKNPLRHYFDSQKNNNKGYIVRKGDLLNNNDNNTYNNDNNNYNNDNNNNDNNNSDNNNLNNNLNDYNTSPGYFNNSYNDKLNPNQIEDLNNERNSKKNNTFPNNIIVDDNSDNNNFNNYEDEKQNNNKEEINTDLNDKSKKEQQELINPNINENYLNNNNNDHEEDSNPLNDRYLILDENGNPIIVNGEKLLGIELIPLIGENGKEVIDDNGNIVLIGPDGKPKSQDELIPILLDNDKPLVNEENKPFLGLNGVPLINGEGNPIIGPGELYDNDNNKVEGILGIVAKDKMGNPIKIKINENNNDKNLKNNNPENDNNNKENKNKYNDNNKKNLGNIRIEDSSNGDNSEKLKKYRNLKPLIGPDGKPIKDSYNKHILLDENNNVVNDTGISLLLDQSGKPVLNSLGNAILLDRDGKPINDDNTLQNQIISFEKPFIAYKKNSIPPKEEIRSDVGRISKIPKKKNNLPNSLKNNRKNKNDVINKGGLNYSECNVESLKKINFMRPYNDPFYDDNEYKVNCFACNLGCSVSKSGYSPMNFSPYNNLIRRRNITPLKTTSGRYKKSKKSSQINLKKINMGNDNNYYLTKD